MKALPPTLRVNKRYVLCRIVPHGLNADGKAVYYAVYEAVSSLFGDAGAAEIGMSVVHTEGDWAIVRCTRGYEKKLQAAVSTVNAIGDMPCAIRPVLTSGTILTLKEKIRDAQSRAEYGTENCTENDADNEADAGAECREDNGAGNVAADSAECAGFADGKECSESNLLYAKKDITLKGISYRPVRVSREKIDLYKEGIKSQDSLYYTIKDIEELQCNQ
ncbi:MAG: Rpp14/Pop5 family protein [Methanomicrobium sp.]|nr:Rpp14/Pop5 family protein [Methanomicrobium sp.]